MTEPFLRRMARRAVPRAIRNAIRHPLATGRAAWHEVGFALGRTDEWRITPDWHVRCHPRTLSAFRAQTEDSDCRDELAAFIALCRPGMVLLDVGSHYGVFTLAALRYGDSARVWSVDPSAACRRLLRANVRLAAAEGRVAIIAAAFGASEGNLQMLSTGPGGEDFFVVADELRPDTTKVPVLTLPGLACRLPVAVTHLKIDVEGYEAEVLAGGWEYLRTVRPLLFLELHCDILRARGKDPVALLEQLTGCGYTRFERRGQPVTVDDITRLPLARLVCLPTECESGAHAEGML